MERDRIKALKKKTWYIDRETTEINDDDYTMIGMNMRKKKVLKAKESEEKLSEEERMRNLSQEGLNPLKAVAEMKPGSKYDLAELFSPQG